MPQNKAKPELFLDTSWNLRPRTRSAGAELGQTGVISGHPLQRPRMPQNTAKPPLQGPGFKIRPNRSDFWTPQNLRPRIKSAKETGVISGHPLPRPWIPQNKANGVMSGHRPRIAKARGFAFGVNWIRFRISPPFWPNGLSGLGSRIYVMVRGWGGVFHEFYP